MGRQQTDVFDGVVPSLAFGVECANGVDFIVKKIQAIGVHTGHRV